MAPDDFIARLAPAALATANAHSIPASFTIAQAALESGWGESRLAREGNNLFGVKAGQAWQGEVLTLESREYLDGTWQTLPARWRKYPDWQACLDDHAAFLRDNPRYAACFGYVTGMDFAAAVARAGYATDPDYASKLQAIIARHQLAALETATGTA